MSTTEESDTEASPFTQANLVGLFLTLSLCLLTQPWGSLLFRPPEYFHDRAVHFCFFLWRLNPIACVAEAVIIAVCLVDTISSVWRRDGRNLSSHAHELHITAAALLFLRDRDRHYKWLEGLDEAGRRSGMVRDSSGAMIAARTLEGALALDPRSRIPDDAGRPTDRAALSPTASEVREAGSLDTQQRAEAAEQLSLSLGSAIMARKESWVDLMASASVLIVMIKLAASSLPWSISVVGLWFMVIGWLAVQALLYLLHLRELNEFGAREVAERAKQLEQLMDRPVIDWLIHLVVVPSLLYLCYVAGFATPSVFEPQLMERPCHHPFMFSAMVSIPFHDGLSDDCH